MKGNVKSQGFIYLVKALCEIEKMNKTGRRIGFELVDEDNNLDESENTSTRINTCWAMRPIKWLIDELTDSESSIGHKRLVLYIMQAMANLNKVSYVLEDAGISIDCNAFDGHYYNAISALSKALDYFCGINADEDDVHEQIDMVSLNDYEEVAKTIAAEHSQTIRREIMKLREDW